MKGYKANWLMVASSWESTAHWTVEVYQKKEEQAAEGEGQGG